MIKRTRPIKPSKNSIWDGLRWIPGPAIKTCPEGIWRAKKATPIKRTEIKKVSKKRVGLLQQYSAQRKAFLAKPFNFYCRVDTTQPATQIHHQRGRVGKLLLDERYWIPVSAEGHRWIHDNPAKAREMGFILSRA